jgi:hypothetical protein
MLTGAEGGARFQDRGAINQKPRLIDGFVGWAARTPGTLAAIRKSFSSYHPAWAESHALDSYVPA